MALAGNMVDSSADNPTTASSNRPLSSLSTSTLRHTGCLVQATAVIFPSGSRFRPSDEVIVGHYLKNKVHGNKFEFDVTCEIDIYKCEP